MKKGNRRMKTTNSTFVKRTGNMFFNQQRRARLDGRSIDYTLDELREVIHFHLKTGLCPYCGDTLTLRNFACDHNEPTSRSHNWSINNLTICCERCNQIKGNMNGSEYLSLISLIKEYPDSVRKNILARLRAGGRLTRK